MGALVTPGCGKIDLRLSHSHAYSSLALVVVVEFRRDAPSGGRPRHSGR